MTASVLVSTSAASTVSGKGDVDLSVVQVAVSAVWLAVLEEVVCVEELAGLADAGLEVGAVQGESVEVAYLRVEGAGEEVVTDAVLLSEC